MSAIDEGIVREYFEQNGFLVRQARKYQVSARRKAAEEEIADNLLTQIARELMSQTGDLEAVRREDRTSEFVRPAPAEQANGRRMAKTGTTRNAKSKS